MNEARAYLSDIFKSIGKNLTILEGDQQTSQAFLEKLKEFYVSLFSKETGFFGSQRIERKLAKAPNLIADRSQQSSPRSQIGLGKGSPGLARKKKVTKRQKRQREKRSITSIEQEPEEIRYLPIKRALVESAQDARQTDSNEIMSYLRLQKTTDTTTTSSTTTPVEPAESDESEVEPEREVRYVPPPRSKPEIQYTLPKNLKRVAMMQKLFHANKDEQANGNELAGFWTLMDNWGRLDDYLVDALIHLWNKCIHKVHDPITFYEQVHHLSAVSNGVTNCIQYFVGSMVKWRIDHAADGNALATLEKIEEDMTKFQYDEYISALVNCKECDSCESVVSFDESYNRYYDQLEANMETAIATVAPNYSDRPMHCPHSELVAHNLRTTHPSLSVSSLQKWYYFANSTPPFSPPTLSLSTPTDVQATTIKYMSSFMNERQLDDPLPNSWKMKDEYSAKDVLFLNKDALHFFDADSAEVVLSKDDDVQLRQLATHGNKIRIRMKHHDAPESKYSFRIFKQTNEEGARMTAFITRHLGIEALRLVRSLIQNCDRVAISVPKDTKGETLVQKDVYSRLLVNVVIFDKSGEVCDLAQKLALQGYTMSFYTTGIESSVDNNMRQAINERKGMFGLPEELFQFPCRPWEIRRLMKTGADIYNEFKAIRNVPIQPEVQWKLTSDIPNTTDEIDDEYPESQETDKFFFKVIECNQQHESLCFKATSTIEGAGCGLFVKPHAKIPKGSHLCLYAEVTSTEEEIRENSQRYAIHISRQNVWFDAELETGVNIGRYANQPHVLESFLAIVENSKKNKPNFTESDWKTYEDEIEKHCNVEFKYNKGQLLIVSKKELQPSRQPQELFINYGGLRSYWIPLVSSDLHAFPEQLSQSVQWLLKSSECNWNDEQREKWSTA